jgi:hypothetical protein
LGIDAAMLAASGTLLPALLVTYIGEHVMFVRLLILIYRRTIRPYYVDVSGLVMHPGGAIQIELLMCGIRLDGEWRSDDQRNAIARFVRALRTVTALDSLKDRHHSLHRALSNTRIQL